MIMNIGFVLMIHTVTCVTQQHIQRHYGLNECAYMLFYRLKK